MREKQREAKRAKRKYFSGFFFAFIISHAGPNVKYKSAGESKAVSTLAYKNAMK